MQTIDQVETKVPYASMAGATILLIDNERSILDGLSRLLGYEGYRVRVASSGLEGVQIALDDPPALVICDLLMEEMDGFSVLRALRGYCGLESLPVIFLSGQTDALRQGMEAGGDDYLIKPVVPDELLRAVRARLNRQPMSLLSRGVGPAGQQSIITRLGRELMAPLTGIIGFSELMLREAMPAHQREMLVGLKASGDRLERLLRKYLFFVRLQMGASGYARSVGVGPAGYTDSSAVVQRSALAAAMANGREEDLRLSLSCVAMPLEEGLIERLVSELVENSSLYSPKGSSISVLLGREAGCSFLEVADEGEGLSPQEVAGIAPFVRYPRPASPENGLGLGLYMVATIAEMAGGDLAVVRRMGRSSVRITFARSVG
jgi:two-component system, sensor histidine kinase and response regulator